MSKEHFLTEHAEGTLWVLNKFFPDNQEVTEIFEGMSHDQLYAVSCLLDEVRKSSNTAEEKFFYIENTSGKYGAGRLGDFEIITIRFGNQEFRSAFKPLGSSDQIKQFEKYGEVQTEQDRSKYQIFKDFVDAVLKFGCPYVDADNEGAMKISLKEIEQKVPAPLVEDVMDIFEVYK